ncbi:MAG TPA: alpha/beta family hydrolase [Steroidobacteraceae bacterium]|nr:alpha/beta family hydrolase [Steroidobacteraceae bacterium]
MAIDVEGAGPVSGLLQRASDAHALFVLAPGAGAGMRHPFLAELSRNLAARGIATLRYQFPYMERNSRRPDPPALCHAAVRGAVSAARRLEPRLPLIAGGKSFGGRMTSQAQAAAPLAGVGGLAFLGFPLHPPKQPSIARAEHLHRVEVPMLFIQGSRDEFAQMALLLPLIERLGARARLALLAEADHSFRARSGRSDMQVQAELMEALADWLRTLPPMSLRGL